MSTTTDWKQHVTFVDTIVLAMPPSAHEELLAELSPLLSNQLVVTVAAGIGPSYLEERLPKGTPVAWIMPNTAAEIGKSISLYTMGQFVNETDQETLQLLLGALVLRNFVPRKKFINLLQLLEVHQPSFITLLKV